MLNKSGAGFHDRIKRYFKNRFGKGTASAVPPKEMVWEGHGFSRAAKDLRDRGL